MRTKKLTFFESMMLVAGAGMGTGLLTIPYAVNCIGLFGTLTALAIALAASAFMYFVIVDLTRNSKRSGDLLGILEEHLFFGKGKRVLTISFFILLILLLLENLVVYILCATNVMESLFGLDGWISSVVFYLLASVVVFFGMKGMGVGEKISVILIGVAVVGLTVLAFVFPKGGIALSFGKPSTVFAVYGLFMFAFSAIFSVIQVCNHIDRPERAGGAVFGGLAINALITLIFAIAAVIGSETVTEVAIIGLADSLDIPAVTIASGILVILAMFTSFWSSGFAFADVVGQQFKLKTCPAWFISTTPALLIAILLPLSVLDYVQIGAGALSIILVLVVLPAYRHAVRHARKPLLLGGGGSSKLATVLVAVAILLMAVASFMPIS